MDNNYKKMFSIHSTVFFFLATFEYIQLIPYMFRTSNTNIKYTTPKDIHLPRVINRMMQI